MCLGHVFMISKRIDNNNESSLLPPCVGTPLPESSGLTQGLQYLHRTDWEEDIRGSQ